jgi:hypothetical protein
VGLGAGLSRGGWPEEGLPSALSLRTCLPLPRVQSPGVHGPALLWAFPSRCLTPAAARRKGAGAIRSGFLTAAPGMASVRFAPQGGLWVVLVAFVSF